MKRIPSIVLVVIVLAIAVIAFVTAQGPLTGKVFSTINSGWERGVTMPMILLNRRQARSSSGLVNLPMRQRRCLLTNTRRRVMLMQRCKNAWSSRMPI
jgi:hypothetical protein